MPSLLLLQQLLLCCCLCTQTTFWVHGFSVPLRKNLSPSSLNRKSSSAIHISISQLDPTSIHDMHGLADVRYDEWMDPNETSREAFREATMEIYSQERPHSVVFVAREEEEDEATNTNNTAVVIGCAEASPYELEGAIGNDNDYLICYYITDVVTNRNHRRRGIGARLARALEKRLVITPNIKVDYFIVNVKPENTPALEFYRKLGYGPPTLELLYILDVEKLEDKAGTKGQLLLCKKLFWEAD